MLGREASQRKTRSRTAVLMRDHLLARVLLRATQRVLIAADCEQRWPDRDGRILRPKNLGAVVAWLTAVVSTRLCSRCSCISFSRQQAEPAAILSAQPSQRKTVLRAHGSSFLNCCFVVAYSRQVGQIALSSSKVNTEPYQRTLGVCVTFTACIVQCLPPPFAKLVTASCDCRLRVACQSSMLIVEMSLSNHLQFSSKVCI